MILAFVCGGLFGVAITTIINALLLWPAMLNRCS